MFQQGFFYIKKAKLRKETPLFAELFVLQLTIPKLWLSFVLGQFGLHQNLRLCPTFITYLSVAAVFYADTYEFSSEVSLSRLKNIGRAYCTRTGCPRW